jgi:hypothetical protein
MTSRTLSLVLRAVHAVGLLGAALRAEAQFPRTPSTSLPGFAGRDPSNSGCFTESWGAAVNNCGYDAQWHIALPVANNATSGVNLVIDVTFYAPAGVTAPSCIAYSVSPYGDNDGSATITAPLTGNSGIGAALYVQPYDSAYLWCTIPPGGKVYRVIYGRP